LIVDRSRDNQHNAPLEVASNDEKATYGPFKRETLVGIRPDEDPAETVEKRQQMELVINVMNNDMTDDQRHVLILRFLEDFSLKETAEIIGKEVNNIKVIQNRGMVKLKRVFEMQSILSA
jgi:RNA polymerase sigma factor (sigma-70 family)